MSIDSALIQRVTDHLAPCGGSDIFIINGELHQVTAKRLEPEQVVAAIQAIEANKESRHANTSMGASR